MRQQGRGLTDEAAREQLAGAIGRRLNGTEEAQAAAAQIVANELSDLSHDLNGLMGRGLSQRQALVEVANQMRHAMLKTQSDFFQGSIENRQLEHQVLGQMQGITLQMQAALARERQRVQHLEQRMGPLHMNARSLLNQGR